MECYYKTVDIISSKREAHAYEKHIFYLAEKRMNKITKLYFAGYFLMFPLLFLISSFIWKIVIKSDDFGVVATDSLSIMAIYYLLVSILFVLFSNRIHKSELG